MCCYQCDCLCARKATRESEGEEHEAEQGGRANRTAKPKWKGGGVYYHKSHIKMFQEGYLTSGLLPFAVMKHCPAPHLLFIASRGPWNQVNARWRVSLRHPGHIGWGAWFGLGVEGLQQRAELRRPQMFHDRMVRRGSSLVADVQRRKLDESLSQVDGHGG